MRFRSFLGPLAAVTFILAACQQSPTETPAALGTAETEKPPETATAPLDPTPGEIVANGVFVGHSGKPMAGARLVLARPIKDDQFAWARVTLVDNVATAVADSEGRFSFKGFAPDVYTIVYQPPGQSGLLPQQFMVKVLSGNTKSITPSLKGFELGTSKPFSERAWGSHFTLLKGHTLYSEGQTMTIRNATARYDQRGPYIEVRRARIWTEQLDDNSEIRLEAWSF